MIFNQKLIIYINIYIIIFTNPSFKMSLRKQLKVGRPNPAAAAAAVAAVAKTQPSAEVIQRTVATLIRTVKNAEAAAAKYGFSTDVSAFMVYANEIRQEGNTDVIADATAALDRLSSSAFAFSSEIRSNIQLKKDRLPKTEQWLYGEDDEGYRTTLQEGVPTYRKDANDKDEYLGTYKGLRFMNYNYYDHAQYMYVFERENGTEMYV